jgi:hypothetical protein
MANTTLTVQFDQPLEIDLLLNKIIDRSVYALVHLFHEHL